MTSQLPRFWRVFFAAGAAEKYTENRTAVTSLRSFLFCDNFRAILVNEATVAKKLAQLGRGKERAIVSLFVAIFAHATSSFFKTAQ